MNHELSAKEKAAQRLRDVRENLKLTKEQKEKLYKDSGYTLTTGRRAA